MGFTKRDVELMKPLASVSRLRGVKVQADREFEQMQSELANAPLKPPYEVRGVKICGFHISGALPLALEQLRQRYPDYEEFLVTNQTTHNMIETWDSCTAIGCLQMGQLKPLPSTSGRV